MENSISYGGDNKIARINDLENGFETTLPFAFGLHVVRGTLVLHSIEFVGTNSTDSGTTVGSTTDKQVTMLLALGDGAPEEDGEGAWDGLEAVYYGGGLLPPENYHFHPGTLSTGVDDPVQGIDSFFPGGLTYSGTAYVAIRLPVGAADDADPGKVAIIARTAKIADYDINGNVTEISYSTNPARVKANLLRRRNQHTRINWESYIHARDYYDELLAWNAGGVSNSFSPYTGVPQDPTLFGPISFNSSNGAMAKTSATQANDNHMITKERIPAGQDGFFKIVMAGTFATFVGGGQMYLTDSEKQHKFGIAWGNGHYAIFANNVAVDDITEPYDFPIAVGDIIELGVSGGGFVLKQNNVVKTIPQGDTLVPDTDLFGFVQFWSNDSSISQSEISGGSVATIDTTVTSVKRFEAHPAFTSPIDLQTAMDFVDALSASDTQDRGKDIVFLTPEPRSNTFTFVEDNNVVESSLRLYRRDVRERPNRLSAKFRNTNTQYLEDDGVFETRDELFDQLGYTVDPGSLSFASMTGSQAQRLIKFNMRRLSDRDLFCELTGMQDSFAVLSGDVVTVVTPKLNNVPKDFLVIVATRESSESTANQRRFTLQEYDPNDYRDSDHDASQSALGPPIGNCFNPADKPFMTLEVITVE